MFMPARLTFAARRGHANFEDFTRDDGVFGGEPVHPLDEIGKTRIVSGGSADAPPNRVFRHWRQLWSNQRLSTIKVITMIAAPTTS